MDWCASYKGWDHRLPRLPFRHISEEKAGVEPARVYTSNVMYAFTVGAHQKKVYKDERTSHYSY